MFPTLKTNLAQMSTFLVCMVLGTSAFGQSDDVDPAFFASLAKTKSHADAALIGERFGFAQETDPNRSTFFQNEKADATLQLLRNFIPSLYVSYRQDTYEQACAIAQKLADANLSSPKIFADPPFWPKQKKLVSGHKASVNGNDVFFGCEQYGPDGESTATMRVQLNP